MKSKIVRSDGTSLDGIKSVVYKEQVNSDTDLRPGCVASASIEVEVYGEQQRAVAVGEELTYYQVDSDGAETLFGTFYAEPTIQTRNTYKFMAYDAVSKLDIDFSERLASIQESFPMTLSALVSEACSVADVTAAGIFPLSDMTVQAFYADGITCRQILSWAAEIACRFVRCDTEGNIKFDWYSAVDEYRITPGDGGADGEKYIYYKQDGLHYENYETSILDRVAVHPTDEEQIAYIYPTSVTIGNTLDITNNILLTGADETVYMSVAQNIYETLSAIGTYRPSQISLFPFNNPFRAGDIAKVTDIQGVSFVTPIMSMIVKESAAQLESTGNKEHAGSSGTLQETLVSLSDNIVRLRKLKVDWADIQQAVIQYIALAGFMTVYEDSTLTTEGGKIGYATGTNSFGGGIAIQHVGDGQGNIEESGVESGVESDVPYHYNGGVVVVGDRATFIGAGKGLYFDGGVDVSQSNFQQYIIMNASDTAEAWPTIEIGVGASNAEDTGREPSIILSEGVAEPRLFRPVNIFNGYSDFEHITAPEIGMLSNLSTSAKESLVAAVNELVTELAGKVPGSRTVNGKALSADITLTAGDVGASAGVDSWYGTSESGASAATKVVSCEGFTLKTGAIVNVLMTNANAAASPTLNVNSTGAAAIRRYGTTSSVGYWWQAGEAVQFVYDGTYYRMVDKMVGNASYYGQLRLSAATNSTNGTGSGYAATPSAVKAAYDRGTEGVNAAATAQATAEAKQTKWTLLWTNSAPTSNFAAQTLTITGLSNCNTLRIEFALQSGTSNTSKALSSVEVTLSGDDVTASLESAYMTETTTLYVVQRYVKITKSSNQIEIPLGYQYYGYSASGSSEGIIHGRVINNASNRIIPIRIYGRTD